MQPPHGLSGPGPRRGICRVWVFDGGPAQRRWPRALRRQLAQACVAQATGRAAQQVDIGHAPSGQPLLPAPPGTGGGLAISLSDTARYLAVALHAGARLGLDIEPRDGRAVPDEPLPWLSPGEAAAIAAAPAAHRREHFVAVWTQKEAYLKALGLGLEGALASFEVETVPRAPARVSRGRPGAPPLYLYRLAGAGWLGALACDTPALRVELTEHALPPPAHGPQAH